MILSVMEEDNMREKHIEEGIVVYGHLYEYIGGVLENELLFFSKEANEELVVIYK